MARMIEQKKVVTLPDHQEELICDVAPLSIVLSQLFVHPWVLSAIFAPLALYIVSFVSCMSHEIVYVSEVLFAVKHTFPI